MSDKKSRHVRTVKEGEPTRVDGVIVRVVRKRKHDTQFRVTVSPVDPEADTAEFPAIDPTAVDKQPPTAQ